MRISMISRAVDRRRGSATVELALVVPLFLMMICGSLEVSRVCSVSEILTNVARDGCRVAVANGQTNTTAQSRMTTLLSNAGITGYSTPVIAVNGTAGDVTTSNMGDQISVTVSVQFSHVTWLPISYVLSSSMTLGGNAVMSSEHNPPN
jgi:Flp pilus assembly protein TadG